MASGAVDDAGADALNLTVFGAQTPAVEPSLIPLLAFKRWCASATLSAPDAVPGPYGLWAFAAGLGALVLASMVVQGPARALGQLLDLPGHARLAGLAASRLRRASRLVATLLGTSILCWTVALVRAYANDSRLKDLNALLRTRTIREVAWDQAVLAALTPLRDVAALADNLLLLVAAAALAFKATADRWGQPTWARALGDPPESRASSWIWVPAWVYALYRAATFVAARDGLPLGGGALVGGLVVPPLMALADGLLLAGVLVALRGAARSPVEGDAQEPLAVDALLTMAPAAALACVATLPGRYLAHAAWLLIQDIPGLARTPVVGLVRGWGLVGVQGASLAFAGLVGAASVGGGIGSTLSTFGRMLRAHGGRLAAATALGGMLVGAASGLVYLVVLALPARGWVLEAADSYAHLATLPLGLWLTSALVELAESTPPARPVEVVPIEAA